MRGRDFRVDRRCTRVWAGLLATLLSTWSLPAAALDLSDDVHLFGFYSLQADLLDNDALNLPRSRVQLDEGQPNVESSLLGVQADYAASERLSFKLQGVVGGQVAADYQPALEWVYLSYDLGQDLFLRGGKFQIPFLQGTELRRVGFSRLWVRPLVPNSGAGGFDDYRGAELLKRATVGDYNLTFQAGVGESEHERDRVRNGRIALLSGRIERNESWLKLALLEARFDIYDRTGRQLGNNLDKLSVSIETEQLYRRWVVNAGYVFGDADLSPRDQLAYLSFGYRAERLTPYLLYQYQSMEFDGAEIPGPPPPPRPGIRPPPPPKDGRLEVNSLSLGVRYDLGPAYAIKAQWEHQKLRDDSSQVTGIIEEHGNIFSLVFEGVF